jgi:prefoldin beta subunit
MEISPQLKNQLNQLEQIRQQIQVLMAQRSQLETQRKEVELAMEGLEGLPEDSTVYKSAGALLIRSDDRGALKTELTEDKESLGLRIATLERQEKKLRERFEELQDTVQKALETGPEGEANT